MSLFLSISFVGIIQHIVVIVVFAVIEWEICRVPVFGWIIFNGPVESGRELYNSLSLSVGVPKTKRLVHVPRLCADCGR